MFLLLGEIVNDGLLHMIVVTYDGTLLSIYIYTNLKTTTAIGLLNTLGINNLS